MFAPAWPKQYGGGELSASKRYILEQELAMADCPTIIPFGVTMIGPVLIEYGTQEQKDFFLPKILNSQHWWCQGYSEPGAGSDLASLKCKAESKGNSKRRGDEEIPKLHFQPDPFRCIKNKRCNQHKCEVSSNKPRRGIGPDALGEQINDFNWIR